MGPWGWGKGWLGRGKPRRALHGLPLVPKPSKTTAWEIPAVGKVTHKQAHGSLVQDGMVLGRHRRQLC